MGLKVLSNPICGLITSDNSDTLFLWRMNHIIEKMKITREEKDKLKSEYEGFKTPMIRACFEPVCVAMKPIGKLTFIRNIFLPTI